MFKVILKRQSNFRLMILLVLQPPSFDESSNVLKVDSFMFYFFSKA